MPTSPTVRIGMLLLVLSVGSLTSCRKSSPENSSEASRASSSAELEQRAAAARKSLEGLEEPLAEVNGKYAALREQFDALPPDLPEFGDTRGQFYAASVALGTMGSKLPWLSDRIDAAVKVGDAAALQEISNEILRTHDQIRQADGIALQMLHKVLPFKQLAEELATSRGVSCENTAAQPKKVSAEQLPSRPRAASQSRGKGSD